MVKWKNSGKKMMVFLLILGLIGGMINPLQFTVAASEKEAGEIPKTEGGMTEEAECVCEILCTAEQKEADCPVCGADLSACVGEPLERQQDESGAAEAGQEPAEGEAPTSEAAADQETDEKESEAETVPGKEPAEEQPSEAETITGKEQPSDSETVSDGEQPYDSETITDGEQPSEAETASEDESGRKPEVSADLETAAVEELIESLPSLEELKTFDQASQDAVRTQFQEVFEAYENLTEEQKALLAGAEERLRELLEYFTEPVKVMATDQEIEAAKNVMTQAMTNWDAAVDLSSYHLTAEDWGKIWPDLAQDNPDLFYVMGGTYYTDASGTIKGCDFTYNPTYSKASVATYRAAIDNVFAEVITANMTDEQKATALHDYLVQHMVYDQNANNHLGIEKRNAYEALVNGIGVCQGYTLAYAALLEKAGIEVGYCKSKSMTHIWNYVKLDGNWYHADLTYDDATAASQVGETGYVKHTYFLLSDAAMRNAQHNWEDNGIVCDDATYDSSWHKTAPLTESAIYSAEGNWYYLKEETVVNNQNICRGAALMKRDVNGTESKVASFEIEDLGSVWPMFSMSFSRLSCSKGILYFNVGNSVYLFNPTVNAAPVQIYRYEDANKRIVTGLLVNGDEMTLEIYNPSTGKMEEKIQVPLFTLSASETKVEIGYTTAPVLTANPLATGFTWSVKRPDGSWETISGANGSSYTVETGLPEGSYHYRVEASLNGKSVSAEIIIMVTNKKDQINFAFPESSKTVCYGDPDFTVSAQGAEAGSSVSYGSSDPSVASVDSATGLVKILKAGSAVITATASETGDYLEAACTYRLTVSPKALSWDTSGLSAADRLDLITNQGATLYGELRLAGILDRDHASVRFSCPSDKLSGVYKTVAEGSQTVKLSWKNGQDQGVFEGTGTGNYSMPSALPEITGRISVVREEAVEGTDYKLQIESGISKVPNSFAALEELNTPGKMEKQMKLKIQQKFGGIAEADMAVYDVELLINIAGTGWIPVTKDNFPSDGLTITLPYPSGTGKDTHDFVVSHMFTAQMNGFYVGDVEYPAVTKTEKGITFKVHGLSPVAVGWTRAQDNSAGNDNSSGSNNNNNTNNNNNNNSGNGGGNNNSGANDNGSSNNNGGNNGGSDAVDPPRAVSAVMANTPSTGDRSLAIWYMLLAGAALAGMLGLYVNIKKNRY